MQKMRTERGATYYVATATMEEELKESELCISWVMGIAKKMSIGRNYHISLKDTIITSGESCSGSGTSNGQTGHNAIN
jgi:hypothetical protein